MLFQKILPKKILVIVSAFALNTLISEQSLMANEVETVSTEIAFFPLDGGSWSGLYFMPRGDSQTELSPIRFNPLARSPYTTYSGPRDLTLFAYAKNDQGEKVLLPICTITLHPTANRQMLLIEENGLPLTEIFPNLEFAFQRGPNHALRGYIFVDTPETFPPESIVFYNTMSATFHGILGDRRITIEPGLSQPIVLSELVDRDIRMGFALNDGERNRRVLDSHFRFANDRRTLFILRPPAREGSFRLRSQRLTEYLGN